MQPRFESDQETVSEIRTWRMVTVSSGKPNFLLARVKALASSPLSYTRRECNSYPKAWTFWHTDSKMSINYEIPSPNSFSQT